jgi:hypothetical protein
LNFGAAAADRILVAVYTWCLPTDTGAHATTGVTIGGVVATRATLGDDDGSGQVDSEIWYAAVPAGTSGDVAITGSGTSANARAIQLYRLVGMTTAPLAAAGNASLTNLSLAVGANGFAVAVSVNQASSTLPTLTGITNSTGVSAGARHGAQFGAQATSVGTLTIGSNLGGENGATKCAASWAP